MLMNLKKVLKVIKKIESKLEKQGNITDARLENHLDNLQQLAIELTFKEGFGRNE